MEKPPKGKVNNSKGEKKDSTLYKCVPVNFLHLPRWLRLVLGYITLTLYCSCFMFAFLLFPALYFFTSYTKICGTYILAFILSYLFPMKEWKAFHKLGQLWYEIFDMHANLSPQELEKLIKEGDNTSFGFCMHPHGIIPVNAILFMSYSDQYLTMYDSETKTEKTLYGFGVGASMIMYTPFLRTMVGWMGYVPADRKSIEDALRDGTAPYINNSGRIPKNMAIMPGGVAEVFDSSPGTDIMMAKTRKGPMKLSLQTGAKLVPIYMFGGNDFFYNSATNSAFLKRISRRIRFGILFWWGKFFCPVIPMNPKVTMVFGKPIDCVKHVGDPKDIPAEKIDEIHKQYIEQYEDLYERYKVPAGYPNGKLEIK